MFGFRADGTRVKNSSLMFKIIPHIMRERDDSQVYFSQDVVIKGMDEYIDKKAEIPFTKENGVYKVKCSINNLPLYFIFDTGASVVSISSVEATFMMKNDYIKPTDIIGKQNYLNANGEISEGTVINLRNVNFGGLNLNDIRASVVHNQSAPLLLGQSVLSRLGNIEIDNVRGILRITYKEEVEQ